MSFKAAIKLMAVVIFPPVLFGCAGAVVESARMTNDAVTRDNYLSAALEGDAEAQYLVGKSFCCAPSNDAESFYNNRKATDFLCRAARQKYPAAAFEVAKIHSGDTVEGVRLLRRTANFVRGDNLDNKVIAYYWYSQAAQHGYAEAADLLNQLEKQDTSQFSSPMTAPCTIDEVYGVKQ
ncbi:sel1 repeat family protein [Amphritea atlantica]|uniref:Sel1 repeat family protein n=1 Tax=Amphritea atlantica TaxID=355243 RepID=A0ABY5GWP9_9GAMM|nr:sel1 repeat family protein [Amphritea atlantica]